MTFGDISRLLQSLRSGQLNPPRYETVLRGGQPAVARLVDVVFPRVRTASHLRIDLSIVMIIMEDIFDDTILIRQRSLEEKPCLFDCLSAFYQTELVQEKLREIVFATVDSGITPFLQREE